ncbi:MAG: transglycosylase domain-containing protein [Treponemataceae bacterium]|nr:transglycosylase domain-containing protein [Treponemataceae bacterium]
MSRKKNTLKIEPFLCLTEEDRERTKASCRFYIKKNYNWLIQQKKQKERRFIAGHPLVAALFRALKAIGKIILCAHGIFILSTSLCLGIFRFINPGATTLMVYRRVGYGWEIKRPLFLPLNKIPRSVRTMVIRVEDGDFYNHRGVLLAALKNAYQLNQKLGSPVYGGSTITMQTARTLFLIPEKSYFRKYLEIIVALEMELLLSKDRILELYLNYAEWGKGIFGIERAARTYYKKGIQSLTTDQAIRIVTLLSSPIRYTPETLIKNGILRSRYLYLVQRFASP